MTPDLARIARAQDGVFSRGPALASGCSEGQIARAISGGDWAVANPGVYRVAGAPATWRSRAWVCLLAAGAGSALCEAVAGKVHRLDGVPAYAAFDVAVPRSRRPRRVPGAIVHRVPLNQDDVVRRSGLLVTSPERTVVDRARTLPPDVGARVIADGLRQGIVVAARLDRELVRAAGRVGVAQARWAARAADPRIEAATEAQLIAIATGVGLAVVPQFEVIVGGRFVARLDAAVPALKVGFEADGYTFHARRDRYERDHERLAELAGAGWRVGPFTPTQLSERPDWVGRAMLDIVAQAQR